jgi:peptidoglycan/LPS O-acetylase OafA/YrhL
MAWTFALVGAAGLVNVYGFGDLLWQVLADGELLLLSLSAAMLALAAHWLRPAAVRGLGWLGRMGQLSYEIYLSHMFIVLAVTRCYADWLGRDMRWTCLVYPPAIWCCVQLGSALARHVGQPAAAWLSGRRPVITVYAKQG